MKKVMVFLCMMFWGNANASLISIELSNTTPVVGETVSVSLKLTGVTSDFASFFSGVEFDSSIFEFVSGSVTSFFPAFDDVITFSGLDIDDSAADTGFVFFNLFEDLLFPISYPAGDYLVAKFDLLVLAEGDSVISPALTELFAAGAFIGDMPQSLSAKVSTSAAVPTPATASLFFLIAAGLVFSRKARR